MAYTITTDIARMIAVKQKEIYFTNYDLWPSEYPGYTTEKEGVKQTETFDSMGNLKAAVEKPEGSPIIYGNIEQAYQTSVTSKTWDNGLAFTIESIKFDLNSVVNSLKSSELSDTMRIAEEERAIRSYDNAFATNLSTGVPLCSNSVPCKNVPGTFNDTLATTSSIGDPDNHIGMAQMFSAFKNHQGKPNRSYPTNAMTHAWNQFTVEEMYQSTNKAGETSNTKNVLPRDIKWQYSHYLSSTTAYFMWDRRFQHALFVWWMKTDFSDEVDFDTKNLKLAVIAMYETCTLPNVGIVGNPGA